MNITEDPKTEKDALKSKYFYIVSKTYFYQIKNKKKEKENETKFIFNTEISKSVLMSNPTDFNSVHSLNLLYINNIVTFKDWNNLTETQKYSMTTKEVVQHLDIQQYFL
jgi:hypothetical protein